MVGLKDADARSIRKLPEGCRMEQSELLRFLVAALERLKLPYFITGSTISAWPDLILVEHDSFSHGLGIQI